MEEEIKGTEYFSLMSMGARVEDTNLKSINKEVIQHLKRENYIYLLLKFHVIWNN